jgi:Na+/melibiose symporter-like transporter
MSYRFMFGFLGGLGASLLGYLVFFAERDGVDGRLVAESYGGFSLACAAIMAASILACALGTHRLIPTLRQPPSGGFSAAGLIREGRALLANRSYRTVVIGLLFASAAGGFNDVVGLYVSTFYWEFTSTEIASFVGAIALAVLVAAPAARPLSERLGKKRAALALASFAILFGPLPIFLRLLGWMPANREPLLFWLIFAHSAIVVAVVFAVSIIVASMITDVVDQHELDTGKRQEGLIISAVAFTQKAASGVGGFVAGLALDVIAFPRGAAPGGVPAEKLAALGLAVGPGLLAFYFLVLYFLSRYEINRRRQAAAPASLAPLEGARTV